MSLPPEMKRPCWLTGVSPSQTTQAATWSLFEQQREPSNKFLQRYL
jgi:hypothetical protein